MNGLEENERNLVKNLKPLFEESDYSRLRKLFVHVNLATKKFRDVWLEWWRREVPPRLEVDMIPVFEEEHEQVLIAGIEVEFFRDRRKSFCDGLQQTLSFGLFGLDSLVLWHVFSENMDNKSIEKYMGPTKEIIEGLNLPFVYFATKLIDKDKFEFFALWKFYSSTGVEVWPLIESLRNSCSDKRNPLLYREEVEKRKKMLKVIFYIEYPCIGKWRYDDGGRRKNKTIATEPAEGGDGLRGIFVKKNRRQREEKTQVELDRRAKRISR